MGEAHVRDARAMARPSEDRAADRAADRAEDRTEGRSRKGVARQADQHVGVDHASRRHSTPIRRVVEGAGGLPLAVYERRPSHADSRPEPTVLLIHGYPDDHRVWDAVADELAERFHVVTYDVRGSGASGVPVHTRGYDLDLLARDVSAVIEATVSPGRALHLVGHDWGSIQGWHFVCEPTFAARVASYTSISGPQLDAVGRFFRRSSSSAPSVRAVLTQTAHSWYVAAFHLPVVAPAFWHSTLARRMWPTILERLEGVPESLRPDEARMERTQLDGAHGVGLYRANMLRSVAAPRPRRTSVPVQVIIPAKDRFVGDALARCALDAADQVVFAPVDAGHWVPLCKPTLIAELVAGHIERTTEPSIPDRSAHT